MMIKISLTILPICSRFNQLEVHEFLRFFTSLNQLGGKRMSKVQKLDERIYLIDGFDMGLPERTGSYVIIEDKITLVETGPSPSVKHIKEGLTSIGVSLEDIKYIIVTHIHLDHAGGAGLLMKECPNAKLVVHPRGERHLVDPSRLVAGARAIYGDSFSDFFDPVIPVPKERILVRGEGDELKIGEDCILKFYDTPGHAKHHFSIYDPISKGLFAGDTAGIRYGILANEGIDLFLPSTSPNHFDPNQMKASIERMQAMGLKRIYFGHFSMTENPAHALRQVSRWIDVFMKVAEEVYVERKESYDILADRMMEKVKEHLREFEIDDDHDVYTIINLDMQINALGIIDYFQRIAH